MDQRIGRYNVLGRVGGGGYGSVYLADDPDLNRKVAIKVLQSGEGSHLDTAAFNRECKAIGAVSNHPHIVTVYDHGRTDAGLPYIVMEYCGGGTLLDLIREGPVPHQRAVRIAIRIAEALDRAHESSILHRDVKPANILFSDYTASLADFGIAHLAGVDTEAGGHTTHYAAPEVLIDAQSSPQSDIYSLGATLHTALNGRRPFSVDDHNGMLQVTRRVLEGRIPPIEHQEVPAGLETFVRRMMALQVADRPESAAAVAAKLRTFLDDDDQTIPGRRQPQAERPGGSVKDVELTIPGRAEGTLHEEASPETALGRSIAVRAVPPTEHPARTHRGLVAGAAIAALGFTGAIAYLVVAQEPEASPSLTGPSSTTIAIIESAPMAPSNIAIDRLAAGGFNITWDPAENAAGYRVSVVGGELFDTATNEFRLDPSAAESGESLCVTVVGFSASGTSGPESSPVCLEPAS